MRSIRPSSMRLGLASCAAAGLVASSSAQTETKRASAPNSFAMSTVTGQASAPRPESANGRSVDGARLRFDLVCEMTWRTIANLEPRPGRSPTPIGERWHQRFREIVDLDKMASCNAMFCATEGPDPIVDADAIRIAFANDEYYQMHVRWRDGRIYGRLSNYYDLIEGHGSCRREPFSGFPSMRPEFADLPPDAGPDLRERARLYPPQSEPFR